MRRRIPIAILAVGWLAVIAYAYPGVMAYDSVDHLFEARAHVYTDGHPPAMAALWRLLEHVCTGPFPMLALSTTCWFAGLYRVMQRAFARRGAAFAAVLVTLFPPVLAPLAVVWKDAMMAGFLMLGAGLVLDGRRVAGLAALSVATAMRYNAFAATLPICAIALQWPVRRALARYAIGAAAWVAITLAATGFDRAITDEQRHYWYSSIALMDIVGTLAHVDANLPDAELDLAGTGILVDRDYHAAIRAHYVANSFEDLVVGEHRVWMMPLHRGDAPAPAAQRDAIARAWKAIVFAHPGAFLAHRAATFAAVLGLTSHNANLVLAHRAQDKAKLRELGLDPGYSAAQDWLERRVLWIARATPMFEPGVYLAVALCLLGLCRGHRDVLALLLSGIALESSLFLAAPTADYRYSHWLVAMTCVAAVLLVRRRSVRPDQRDHQEDQVPEDEQPGVAHA